MAVRNVADVLWEMLANAGGKTVLRHCRRRLESRDRWRLRRNGKVDFASDVRHEEYGVFAAVADANFTGVPEVAVCGTAGPGVVHLFNGLMDARKERRAE